MENTSNTPSSQQDYMDAIINSDSLTFKEQLDLLKEAVCDESLKETSMQYLKSREYFLEKVPDDLKDLVKCILTQNEWNLDDKMEALQDLGLDDQIFMEGLNLLVEMEPASCDSMDTEEDTAVKIPDIVDFPVLESIYDSKIYVQMRKIFKENKSTNEEKERKLFTIITNKNDLKKCRIFLEEMERESKLLKQLPSAIRANIAAILRETAMNYMDKRESLKYCLENGEHRKMCRNYLRAKDARAVLNNSDKESIIPVANLNFLEKCPDEMNILVLGETGVGKSTFINGFANYLKFQTMNKANNSKDVEILISSCFTLTDNNFNEVTVDSMAKGDIGNENFEDGKSSTLFAMPYVFQWGALGNVKKIRLIDTPGVGDVSGFEKDKKNFDSIFNHLADYKELHAICILLKPNDSRLTTSFTYCLGELLSRFGLSIKDNILFCFTNTRQTLYRSGETGSLLNAFMEELRKTRPEIDISIHRSTLFCFDSESFRFLCAWKKGITFTVGEIQNFNKSWTRSVEEVFRLLIRVSQLRPHILQESIAINNVRMAFNILARPLAELQKKRNVQKRVLQGAQMELSKLEEEIMDLKDKNMNEHMTTTRRSTGRIDTVCASDKCSSADQYNLKEMHFNVCHKDCKCPKTDGAKKSKTSEVKLQNCSCMDELKCKECGCQWFLHMHIDYELVTAPTKDLDITVKQRFTDLQREIDLSKAKVDELTSKMEQTARSYELISENTTELAAFLIKEAILPYNQYKGEYLEKLIQEEKQATGQGGSRRGLTLLEQSLDDHEQQIVTIDACKKTTTKSGAEMERFIDELKEKEIDWGIQTDLPQLILLKTRKEPTMRSVSVDLNEGWMGLQLQ